MNKGEIFNCIEYDHLFVFLDDIDEVLFKGTMITSTDRYPDYNVPFWKSHIIELDDDGNRFPFQFRNSHFVFVLLVKRNDVSGLEKIGELTSSGIDYVESSLENEESVEWSDSVLQ